MAKYRLIPVVVDATQYLPDSSGGVLPPGVHPANVREYAHKPYVIVADGQRMFVEPGDWIVALPFNRGYIPYKPEIFASMYELTE